MKHCIHCGEAIKKDTNFCINCGKPIETKKETGKAEPTHTPKKEPVSEASLAPHQSSEQQNKPKKPFFKNKRSKILTTIIASIAILFLGTYFVMDKYIFNPESVADKFVAALNEKDVPKIQSLMKEDELKSNTSKEEIKTFLEYLDNNPKMLSNISSHVKEEAISISKGNSNLAEGFEYIDEETLGTINKDGKKWLLFDRYAISFIPMYLEVHLPEEMDEKVELFVNDQKEKSKKNDVVNIGPLLPGNHDVKAVVDGKYGKVVQEQKIDFSEAGTEASIDIDFQHNNYVDIYSDNFDAKVYVNGKDTKQKIEDFEKTGIGPLPKDGSVEVYAEKKFSSGKQKTDVITIDEDTDDVALYFDYFDYEEMHDVYDIHEEYELDEEEDIENIIYSHYDGISNQNYSAAYDYFSDSKKEEYSLADWQDGLEDTIEDIVDYVEVDNISGVEAKASLGMTSYEEDGDDILVNEWEGYWELIWENGEWKLDKAKLDKVDSWTE